MNNFLRQMETSLQSCCDEFSLYGFAIHYTCTLVFAVRTISYFYRLRARSYFIRNIANDDVCLLPTYFESVPKIETGPEMCFYFNKKNLQFSSNHYETWSK